ncbi:MAG: hypothetical protein ACW99A_16825, partial [Candidatus Kariarchaeaceae archaeon]
MDFPDWLDDGNLTNETNPYLSLIKKIAIIDDNQFNQDVGNILRENKFTHGEKKIIDHLASRNQLSKINILMTAIKSNCPLDKITKQISWFDFELLTGEILNQANWNVRTNFRYFGEGGQRRERNRFEVDVFAWQKPFVLLIDNKRHAKTSNSYLKDAVIKQQNRTYELFEMIPIIHELPEMEWSKKWDHAILFPIIVTWRDQGIVEIKDTPIVSSRQLIDLLQNLRMYFEERSWF